MGLPTSELGSIPLPSYDEGLLAQLVPQGPSLGSVLFSSSSLVGSLYVRVWVPEAWLMSSAWEWEMSF